MAEQVLPVADTSAEPSPAPAPPPAPPFRLGFRPALDGIRGVLVVIVVAVHMTYLLVPKYTGRFIAGGFVALDVFFVLSGFLITSLLLEEWDRRGRISIRGFYRRRALRLFPALWTVMAVQLVYSLVVHDSLRKELKGLAAIALYVGNFSWKFHAVIPDTLGQAWSLAVEEQFYLIWPALLVLLLHLRNRRLTVGTMVGFMAVALVSRILLFNAGVSWLLVYVQTETRLDALMMGCLMAYLLHRGVPVPRFAGFLGGVGTGFLVLITLLSHREDAWLYDGGFTLVAIAGAFIVCAALDSGTVTARVLALRPCQACGRASYSVYLWHVLVFFAVIRWWPGLSDGGRVVVAGGLTAFFGALSYRFVEKPFLKRKNADKAKAELRDRTPSVG